MSINTFISTPGEGIARAVQEAEDSWVVEFLLDGEAVTCLAATPTNHDIVYAGTQGNGVLKSTDRGKTWQPVGPGGQNIRSLAVSRTQPDTIFAGGRPPMVFVSHDGGENWSELEAFRKMRQWWWFTPADANFRQPYVQGLAVSPTDPDVILAGIEYGAVLRSDDGGTTWSTHCKGAIRDCHMLAFHATDGNWVYEGGGGGAAYSNDGGKNWSSPDPMKPQRSVKRLLRLEKYDPATGGLEHRYGWAVGADPAQPAIWYCATSPGPQKAHGGGGNAEATIYRSRDGGNWEPLSGGLPQPLDHMPYGLITAEGVPGHLYACLSNGDIWHTLDHGDTWVQLPVNLKGIHRSVIGL